MTPDLSRLRLLLVSFAGWINRLSFAKTLSARLIDLRSVWGLETLETGTRPGVRVARRRPGGDKILGATQNDPEERRKQLA
jgi:hypothetical protein